MGAAATLADIGTINKIQTQVALHTSARAETGLPEHTIAHGHGTWTHGKVRVFLTPPRARHRRAAQLPSHIHDCISHGKEDFGS